MVGRTNAGGGGKLKYASGTLAASDSQVVSGLGFRPYIVLLYGNSNYYKLAMAIVCNEDGEKVLACAQNKVVTTDETTYVTDDGFVINSVSNYALTWYAFGK